MDRFISYRFQLLVVFLFLECAYGDKIPFCDAAECSTLNYPIKCCLTCDVTTFVIDQSTQSRTNGPSNHSSTIEPNSSSPGHSATLSTPVRPHPTIRLEPASNISHRLLGCNLVLAINVLVYILYIEFYV